MSTFLCILPHLSPAGCCSITNLPYPCLSRASRGSSPIHSRAAASFHCNDLFQGLVCRYAGIQCDYMSEQCMTFLVDYVILYYVIYFWQVGGIRERFYQHINTHWLHSTCLKLLTATACVFLSPTQGRKPHLPPINQSINIIGCSLPVTQRNKICSESPWSAFDHVPGQGPGYFDEMTTDILVTFHTVARS